jgi:small subunit ribosomal protein S20
MANIKQQKKRVRIAARERVENLRFRSTAKTLMKRLERAADGGDATAVETEHRQLVKLLDRAASRGALHKNTVARRKARAAKVAARRGS